MLDRAAKAAPRRGRAQFHDQQVPVAAVPELGDERRLVERAAAEQAEIHPGHGLDGVSPAPRLHQHQRLQVPALPRGIVVRVGEAQFLAVAVLVDPVPGDLDPAGADPEVGIVAILRAGGVARRPRAGILRHGGIPDPVPVEILVPRGHAGAEADPAHVLVAVRDVARRPARAHPAVVQRGFPARNPGAVAGAVVGRVRVAHAAVVQVGSAVTHPGAVDLRIAETHPRAVLVAVRDVAGHAARAHPAVVQEVGAAADQPAVLDGRPEAHPRAVLVGIADVPGGTGRADAAVVDERAARAHPLAVRHRVPEAGARAVLVRIRNVAGRPPRTHPAGVRRRAAAPHARAVLHAVVRRVRVADAAGVDDRPAAPHARAILHAVVRRVRVARAAVVHRGRPGARAGAVVHRIAEAVPGAVLVAVRDVARRPPRTDPAIIQGRRPEADARAVLVGVGDVARRPLRAHPAEVEERLPVHHAHAVGAPGPVAAAHAAPVDHRAAVADPVAIHHGVAEADAQAVLVAVRNVARRPARTRPAVVHGRRTVAGPGAVLHGGPEAGPGAVLVAVRDVAGGAARTRPAVVHGRRALADAGAIHHGRPAADARAIHHRRAEAGPRAILVAVRDVARRPARTDPAAVQERRATQDAGAVRATAAVAAAHPAAVQHRAATAHPVAVHDLAAEADPGAVLVAVREVAGRAARTDAATVQEGRPVRDARAVHATGVVAAADAAVFDEHPRRQALASHDVPAPHHVPACETLRADAGVRGAVHRAAGHLADRDAQVGRPAALVVVRAGGAQVRQGIRGVGLAVGGVRDRYVRGVRDRFVPDVHLPRIRVLGLRHREVLHLGPGFFGTSGSASGIASAGTSSPGSGWTSGWTASPGSRAPTSSVTASTTSAGATSARSSRGRSRFCRLPLPPSPPQPQATAIASRPSTSHLGPASLDPWTTFPAPCARRCTHPRWSMTSPPFRWKALVSFSVESSSRVLGFRRHAQPLDLTVVGGNEVPPGIRH